MKKRHHSEEEQAKLLHFFDEERVDPAVLLIEVIYYTGARLDEILSQRVSSIDAGNSMLHITKPNKGSEQRSMYVPPHVIKALIRQCEERDLSFSSRLWDLLPSEENERREGETEEDFLKRILKAKKKMMHRRWQRYRLKIFGFGFFLGLHAHRHSLADRIMKLSGNNMIAVQRALGHKYLKTTEHYVKHIDMNDVNEHLKRFSRNRVKRIKKLAS